MFPVNYTIYNDQHNGINFINVIIQSVKKAIVSSGYRTLSKSNIETFIFTW